MALLAYRSDKARLRGRSVGSHHHHETKWRVFVVEAKIECSLLVKVRSAEIKRQERQAT